MQDDEQKSIDVCTDKAYFLIGRHLEADLCILDQLVSRFHATIFREGEDFVLVDHSLNGTFYNLEANKFNGGSRVVSVANSEVFTSNKSRLEVLAQERKLELPKIPGYQPSKLAKREDVEYLLAMINDPEQAKLLASCGRRLVSGAYIGIKTLGRIMPLQVEL